MQLAALGTKGEQEPPLALEAAQAVLVRSVNIVTATHTQGYYMSYELVSLRACSD